MHWASMLTVVTLGLASLSSSLQAQQEPRFKISTYSTLHELRVLDQQGDRVPGLTRSDFRVVERDAPRPTLFFEEHNSAAVSLGILLDRGSTMTAEAIASSKEIILELVHILDPADEVIIGTYQGEVHFLSDLTRDRHQLSRAVENISPGGRAGFWSRLGAAFGSSGYTGSAVDHTLLQLKKAEHPIRIVLVISAAFGNLGEATRDHLLEAGARFFGVGFPNRMGDALGLWGDKTARGAIIRQTAGVSFVASRVAEDLSLLRKTMKHFYLLAYEPTEGSEEFDEQNLKFSVRGHPEYRVHSLRRVGTRDSFFR